jgi:hypothetical protein
MCGQWSWNVLNDTALFCNVRHSFLGHIVTGKIHGLMLADILDFHMILLLRKQYTQIRGMLMYAQQTWHFDGWRRDPNNVIGKIEIQVVLGTLGVDYWSTKADRN